MKVTNKKLANQQDIITFDTIYDNLKVESAWYEERFTKNIVSKNIFHEKSSEYFINKFNERNELLMNLDSDQERERVNKQVKNAIFQYYVGDSEKYSDKEHDALFMYLFSQLAMRIIDTRIS